MQSRSIKAIRFNTVPNQVTLSSAVTERTLAEETFERETAEVIEDIDIPVDVGEVVSHDFGHTIANYAGDTGVDIVLGEWEPDRLRGQLLDRDVEWYFDHLPCDLIFVQNRGLGDVDNIAVIADQDPYDPMEIVVADAIARNAGTTIRFIHAVGESASEEQTISLDEYYRQLAQLCDVPTERDIYRSDDRYAALRSAANTADLVIVGTSAHHLLYNVVFGTIPDRLATGLDSTVLHVYSQKPRRHTFIRYLLDRFIF